MINLHIYNIISFFTNPYSLILLTYIKYNEYLILSNNIDIANLSLLYNPLFTRACKYWKVAEELEREEAN